MGIDSWGSSPLYEIGISRRSVYQMTTSREQALGEGNCARATERGKEACEWLGKRRFCPTASERYTLLGCISTKSATLRTGISYTAESVRRLGRTTRTPQKRHHRLSNASGNRKEQAMKNIEEPSSALSRGNHRHARRPGLAGLRKHEDHRFNSPSG